MEKTVRKGKYRIAIAAALCACALAIAGALAFYTDTETVVNKLSLDTNLDIELTEPVWDANREADPNYGMDLNPYQTIVKDPTITNKGTIPAYVAVSVSIPVFSGNLFDWDNGVINQVTDSDLFIPSVEEGWTLKDTSAVKDGFRTYTYIYDQVMNHGDSKKFFNEVQVANIIDDIGINATEIVVNGFGIQAEGFANVDEAWNAYLLQNGFIDITINDPAIEQGRTYDIDKQVDNTTIATAEAEQKATVTFASVPVEIGAAYEVKDDETGEKVTEFTVESVADVTNGTIKVDNPVAFAVYSADDNSLDFYKRTDAPTAGETYQGKTATTVYLNVEQIDYEIPWTSKVNQITKVEYVDEINPVSTANWFNGATNLTTINRPENLNTTNTTAMQFMFASCVSLRELDVTHINTSNAVWIHSMFSDCTSLESLDLSSWNTDQATNMSGLFSNCKALKTIKGLSTLNTANVTDMSNMFGGCESIMSLDVSQFITAKVTNFENMFGLCASLVSISGLENWNTSQVENMSAMFNWCESLTSIDISHFNNDRLTNSVSMFSNTTNLTTIYASSDADWSHIATSDDMFYNCPNLSGANSTKYDANHTDATYARVDGLNGHPGYYTAKAA